MKSFQYHIERAAVQAAQNHPLRAMNSLDKAVAQAAGLPDDVAQKGFATVFETALDHAKLAAAFVAMRPPRDLPEYFALILKVTALLSPDKQKDVAGPGLAVLRDRIHASADNLAIRTAGSHFKSYLVRDRQYNLASGVGSLGNRVQREIDRIASLPAMPVQATPKPPVDPRTFNAGWSP